MSGFSWAVDRAVTFLPGQTGGMNRYRIAIVQWARAAGEKYKWRIDVIPSFANFNLLERDLLARDK